MVCSDGFRTAARSRAAVGNSVVVRVPDSLGRDSLGFELAERCQSACKSSRGRNPHLSHQELSRLWSVNDRYNPGPARSMVRTMLKSIWRWSWRLALVFFAALTLAACAMWIRSYWRVDFVQYNVNETV